MLCFVSAWIVFLVFLVILATNLFYAVLWLVAIYGSTGSLFIVLGAEYVGLTFIIVYVGAIAILFLFVIMLFSFYELEILRFSFIRVGFVVVLVCLLGEGVGVVSCIYPFFLWHSLSGVSLMSDMLWRLTYRNDTLVPLSLYFFNFYGIYCIGAGLLLLAILVGAVVLLRPDEQSQNFVRVASMNSITKEGALLISQDRIIVRRGRPTNYTDASR